MSDWKINMEKLKDQVLQKRDELKVKIHLGRADLKDEWDKLEGERKKINQAINDTSDEAEAALEDAYHELKKGYELIKKKLSE